MIPYRWSLLWTLDWRFSLRMGWDFHIGNSNYFIERLTKKVLPYKRMVWKGSGRMKKTTRYGVWSISPCLFIQIQVSWQKNVWISQCRLVWTSNSHPTFRLYFWNHSNNKIYRGAQKRRLFERWFQRWSQICSRQAISLSGQTRNIHWGLNP